MENEENKSVVTVENEGGKGNPNHKPAGSPDGGQFTSGPQSASAGGDEMGEIEFKSAPQNSELKSALNSFIGRKKEEESKKAREFIDSIKSEISEDSATAINNYSREQMLAFLEESPTGYDKKRLMFATEDQLRALLYAEAVKAKRIHLEQQLTIIEKQKTDIQKNIDETLAQNNIENFVGMWLYAVHPADYAGLKESGKFDKKKQYYQDILANPDAQLSDKVKATQFLAKLDALEKAGLEYEELKSKLNSEHIDELEALEAQSVEISNQIKQYSPDSDLIQSAEAYCDKFTDKNSAYSKARKDKATWISAKWIKEHPEYHDVVGGNLSMIDDDDIQRVAQKHFGPRFIKMWESMTPSERSQLKDYTGGGFSKYNRPLRGLPHPGWHGWEFATGVKQLTSAIDKCTWDEDFWVQRGISDSKIFKIEGDKSARFLSSFTDDELQKLVGTSFKDNGFCSTGAGKGTGFDQEPVIFNIYCPKGTKAAYMNLHGNYAHSTENEMILQRGYEYRITKVERKGGHYYIDCEVVLGSDADKVTDMDELSKIGSTYLK